MKSAIAFTLALISSGALASQWSQQEMEAMGDYDYHVDAPTYEHSQI